MFTNKKSVIFITKSKIRIMSVVLGSKPKENVIVESDWNFDNLQEFFSKNKKFLRNPARLLLSEDFVYVVMLSFPSSVVLNKDIIGKKAQEFIPESLNETIWDFKEVSITSSLSRERKILVAAAVKNIYESLSEKIFRSGLRIETIEPLSFSFTRYTQKQFEPVLFVYLYDKAYLTLTQKEEVFATERLDLPINKEKIRKFILFTKENSGILPKKVIFCGNTKDINLKEYEKENFRIEIKEFSPTISLAYKEDFKDKDKKALNLQLFRNFSTVQSPIQTSVKKGHFPIFWIIAILLVMIVIAAEILIYFKFGFNIKPI